MLREEQPLLSQLRDLSLEEGRAYIRAHLHELLDHNAVGRLIKDESLRQLYIHPQTALKLAELLIYFGSCAHHPWSHALGLTAKGDALSAFAHEQAAMEYFDAAAAEFVSLHDEVSAAHTRIGWIISCAWIGRVEEALQAAAQAHAILLQHNELYYTCTLDHNTAVIYSQIGEYQKALDIYERVLLIYPQLTDRSPEFIRRAIALVKLNQGRNLSWLGKFDQARYLLSEAGDIFTTLGEWRLLINVEMSLADIDYVQGFYGSALRRYYSIQDIIKQHDLEVAAVMSTAQIRIARCLVKLNRAEEASVLAVAAVEAYTDSEGTLDKGDALFEYATVLIAAQRLKEAEAVLNEAGSLFDHGGFEHHSITTKLLHAQLLIEMGQYRAAYEPGHRLQDLATAQGLIFHALSARLIMADSLVKQARQISDDSSRMLLLNEALALCQSTEITARGHHLQEQRYKAFYLIGQVQALQEDLDAAERYYLAAIEQIEAVLEDLVLDLRPSFLRSTWVVYEDMIALSVQRQQPVRAFDFLERARSLALRQYLGKTIPTPATASLARTPEDAHKRNASILRIQNELHKWQDVYHACSARLNHFDPSVSLDLDRSILETELKRSEVMVGELFERLHLFTLDASTALPLERRPHVETLSVTALQEQLAPRQMMLTYFLHHDQLMIFSITREKVVVYESPAGILALERLLPPLYAHLEPRGWPDPHQPPQHAVRRILQKLYQVLIAPVTTLQAQSFDELIIVPYGILHNLPFHAFYDGSRFLIEHFQISYLPVVSILPQLSKAPAQVDAPKALIFGYSGDGELLRAVIEARDLAAMFDGFCFLDEQATIESLIAHAPGSTIIHLATHGKMRLDAPNFSYICMADGQLNAIDAFFLNLEGCQLVTLSGCETGLALSGGGDEQLGLGRAFLAAGASSLLMSLWPVEDEATNELMERFYRRLLKGESKAQALRSAQCELLQHSSSHYVHPYFWAAFRLVGNTGPL